MERRSVLPESCRWATELLRSVGLYLCLAVLFIVGFLGHFGGLDHSLQHSNRQRLLQRRPIGGGSGATAWRSACSHLEASFPLLDILLWVEDDDVDLGHVEHPEGDEGAERHGHGQSGRLDEHLGRHVIEVSSF